MVTFESFQHDEVTGLKFGYALFSKPTLYTHIYHVDGLLIDTGQRKAQKRILNETKDLKVDQIFITHHHEDQSGNIEALQKQFSCDVFASTKCCELMQNPPSISFAQKMTWGDRPAYNKLKPVDGVIKTGKYSFQLIPIPGSSEIFKSMRLKENHMVNFLSGGMLSKLNMVRSVIKDMEEVSG